MFERVRQLWDPAARQAATEHDLEKLRDQAPVPVFWLFGKTQSGKTSIIKFLTGAAEAEIGEGFRPTTKTSRIYQFPTAEAPLVGFLDTRGLDEPGYEADDDIAAFDRQAHLVLVVVKALDHATENVRAQLVKVRRARPDRPVLFVLTTLHEAYPQHQHPPYPFEKTAVADFRAQIDEAVMNPRPGLPADLVRSVQEQLRKFDGLIDAVVPIDLTKPEEGFEVPEYGGAALKAVLLDSLPGAYAQTLRSLSLAAGRPTGDEAAHKALPVILGYCTLATAAGAVPIPWVDLLVLPGIQTQMVHHLAKVFGRPLSARHFAEVASALGTGVVARQAAREVAKFIPFVGAVAGAALAGASTYALGQSFCYYYRAALAGQPIDPAELRRVYREQLTMAEQFWAAKKP